MAGTVTGAARKFRFMQACFIHHRSLYIGGGMYVIVKNSEYLKREFAKGDEIAFELRGGGQFREVTENLYPLEIPADYLRDLEKNAVLIEVM
jgi:hypothetical protein